MQDLYMQSALPKNPRGRPLKGNSHRKRITLTLESDFLSELTKIASALGMSRSDYVQ